MSYENIRLEIHDGIARVTVNRPAKLNALNQATIGELTTCFQGLINESTARVVLLTGEGPKAFVAGADISELANLRADQAEQYALAGQYLMDLIENLGKVVIAVVNGFALGGGCELAMACSLRLAAESAKLGLPETGLGLIPGFGGTQRLARLVGRGRAQEMVLTGDMVTADQALAMGLVNKVFPAAELMLNSEKLAGKLARKSLLTSRLALRAVGEGLQMPQSGGCGLEASLFGVAAASGDAREGCAAFLEKRKPKFGDC